MKKYIIIPISLFVLINLFPMSRAAECINKSGSEIDDQIKNFARIKQKLVKLQCTEPQRLSSLITTDKHGFQHVKVSVSTAASKIASAAHKMAGAVHDSNRELIRQNARNIPSEFIHDEAYCKKMEACTDFEEIKALESTARIIFNRKMQELTFQKALWEQAKSADNFCGMDEMESSCKEVIKEAYNVDNEEKGLTKIFEIINHVKKDKWTPTAAEGCQKFKINEVCKNYTSRINSYSSCEDDLENPGTDCYHDLQGVFFNLLRDNHSNEPLYWALEQQLCRPTRIFKPISNEAKLAQENPNFVGPVRAPEDDTALEMIPGGSVAIDNVREYAPNSFRTVDNFDRNTGFGSNYNKNNSKMSDLDGEASLVSSKSDSVLNNFSAGLKEAYDNQNNDSQKNNFIDPNSALNNASNFSNYMNHNDSSIKDDTDKKGEEQNPNLKKDEIGALNAQIESLNKKLSEMSNKLEELKSNPKSSEESSDADKNKANLEKQKSILELKNKIAELENQKKDLVAKQARDAESKLINSSTNESSRSIASYSSPIASVNDYEDKSSSQNSASQQAYTPPPSSGAGEISRSPSSTSSNSSGAGQLQTGPLLRTVTSQGASSADYSTVYLTQDEVKNYPYRLDINASDVEVEKMIKESNGAPILLGESEQVVGVKENGKLIFKRIKVVVVKNDKVKKESISRAISSVADLKKEEEKKSRDYIRYQEMKKGLKINK